jgi:hypothetical protein
MSGFRQSRAVIKFPDATTVLSVYAVFGTAKHCKDACQGKQHDHHYCCE